MTTAQLLVGDVRETLRELPVESAHCCVTSPPYWRLRDYGTGTWEGGDPECSHAGAKKKSRYDYPMTTATVSTHAGKDPGTDAPVWLGECPDCGSVRRDQQLGQEAELDCRGGLGGAPCGECYVCHMVAVFREVRHVLRKDGTLWLNLGTTIHNKQDQLVPHRVALALQSEGWYLRREIIWAKGRSFDPEGSGACMPSSVRDAPTYSHEQIFLFSKSPKYYYDRFAVAEEGTYAAGTRAAKGGQARRAGAGVNARPDEYAEYTGTRNLRSVWVLPRENETAGHYATFPSALPETCIKASTSEKGVCPKCGEPWQRVVEHQASAGRLKPGYCLGTGTRNDGERACSFTPRFTHNGWEPGCECGGEPVPATVLDPFAGLAKTGVVALRLGRSFVGIELNQAYAQIARDRLAEAGKVKELGGLFAGMQEDAG